LWQAIIRVFAFISKEVRTIWHQPRLIFSLILGPFLSRANPAPRSGELSKAVMVMVILCLLASCPTWPSLDDE
jgi:hypothetical protein